MDFKFFSDLMKDTESKLILTLIFALFFIILRSILVRIVNNQHLDIKTRFRWRQTINYIIVISTMSLIAVIWSKRFESIFTLLTLISAALILVSKELILNFIANTVIMTRNLFMVGDRIQIGDNIGDVLDSGPLYFTLAEIGTKGKGDTPSGRIIKFPNSLVLTLPVVNFTKNFPVVWNEFDIDVDIKSNHKKAEQIILDILLKHSYTFEAKAFIEKDYRELIFIDKKAEVYSRLEKGLIKIHSRYPVELNHKHEVEIEIWTELIPKLKNESDIEIVRTIT